MRSLKAADLRLLESPCPVDCDLAVELLLRDPDLAAHLIAAVAARAARMVEHESNFSASAITVALAFEGMYRRLTLSPCHPVTLSSSLQIESAGETGGERR